MQAVPSAVYLDTNVILAALMPAIPHHHACADFCDAVVAGRTRAFCSRVLRLEFGQVWFQLPNSPYLGTEMTRQFRLGAWGRNSAVREQWMAEGVAQLATFFARFDRLVEDP